MEQSLLFSRTPAPAEIAMIPLDNTRFVNAEGRHRQSHTSAARAFIKQNLVTTSASSHSSTIMDVLKRSLLAFGLWTWLLTTFLCTPCVAESLSLRVEHRWGEKDFSEAGTLTAALSNDV